jgi:hypothetical protein
LDGSADFASLELAEQASAPGDTIVLAPGHYSETYEWSFQGGLTRQVVLGVATPWLTVLGESRDTVLIGPVEPEGSSSNVVGVAVREDAPGFVLKGVTILNTGAMAMQLGGDGATIFGLRVEQSPQIGIGCEGDSTVIEHVSIANVRTGLYTFSGGVHSAIRDCEIVNVTTGIVFQPGNTGLVERTELSAGVVGAQVDRASVTYEGCTFRDFRNDAFVVLGSSAVVQIRDCNVEGGDVSLTAGNAGPQVHVEACRLVGAGFTAFDLEEGSLVTVSGSDIVPLPGAHFVITGAYRADPPIELDFSGNWWGTTDLQEIADRITDGNDEPPLGTPREDVFIRYEPIELHPVPLEETSVGALKGRYRR